MGNPQIRVSPELSLLIEQLGEKNCLSYLRSGKSLAEKHVGLDRQFLEIGKRQVEFSKEITEFEFQKRDVLAQLTEKNFIRELQIKIDKLEREIEHLRELNKLR